MSRYPTKPRYYSVGLTEDEIMAGGERLAKGIPYYRAREKMIAEQKGRLELCLTHRKGVKTPYKVGDLIAITTKADYGTLNKPCVFRIVAVAKIIATRELYDYVTVEEGVVRYKDILGKVRK